MQIYGDYCEICDRSFANQQALQQHNEAKMHYYCRECERHFGDQMAKDQHDRDKHAQRRALQPRLPLPGHEPPPYDQYQHWVRSQTTAHVQGFFNPPPGLDAHLDDDQLGGAEPTFGGMGQRDGPGDPFHLQLPPLLRQDDDENQINSNQPSRHHDDRSYDSRDPERNNRGDSYSFEGSNR